jgi:hypothetical protein
MKCLCPRERERERERDLTMQNQYSISEWDIESEISCFHRDLQKYGVEIFYRAPSESQI